MGATNLSVILDQRSPGIETGYQDVTSEQCDPRVSEQFLRAFGRQSSSYFSLQPDCHHYLDPCLGYVPYVPVYQFGQRINVVPTRPVVADQHLPALLKSFENEVPGQALFVGVDGATAQRLTRRGYDATMMGTEFSVDLADFSVRGRAMKQLRHARNLHRRLPVQVDELPSRAVNRHEVEAISEAWRQRKAVKQRELGLLTRPPVLEDEWGVRKFYAFMDQKLCGYVFFDPYYDNGRLQGYCANILRASPEANRLGVLDHIVLRAIEQFRHEGVAEVSLGIAPLHGLRPFPGDRPGLRWAQQGFYRFGNRLYAFQPLAYHKSRYRGRETPWFLCARNTSSLRVITTLLKGTGLIAAS
ncbi:DUF2156 domain-containing protein [Marinobacter sp. CHS3-4]|uniref:DUF2156 domain-containing protein n=1 Tax=Marinobacter sp. CHS3-4 TaxID=3045174 RepID=UPI0024B4FD7F|nr:DUF2156 domain-containing protein [Marinobacter sp. CHS3-4]MDI9243655.1 DUF2156 domain-containing protein [Marinobacter sp. CHS3-4]